MDHKKIGEVLKIWREVHDLSRRDLARVLGCTYYAVRLWELGKRKPWPALRKRIFVLTGGSVDYSNLSPDGTIPTPKPPKKRTRHTSKLPKRPSERTLTVAPELPNIIKQPSPQSPITHPFDTDQPQPPSPPFKVIKRRGLSNLI